MVDNVDTLSLLPVLQCTIFFYQGTPRTFAFKFKILLAKDKDNREDKNVFNVLI